jgi:hypothetical protein
MDKILYFSNLDLLHLWTEMCRTIIWLVLSLLTTTSHGFHLTGIVLHDSIMTIFLLILGNSSLAILLFLQLFR